jgi:DMSO/TMAO reductase YedYZ molybdopterin-dependent catalytic subunit
LSDSRPFFKTPFLRRRDFLRSLLVSPALVPCTQSALLARTAKFLERGSASKEPERGPLTANADFFVRSHFASPQMNADSWKLEIAGLVSEPLHLSYSDLLLTTPVRVALTMECAGNLSGGKGVGNAMWSGVPLAALLKQAGIKSGASNVILYGADSGKAEDLPAETNFARAIPIDRAMRDSTILAYEMNGSPLPADHGFPLRALVGGWYGMDSVKWLTRIEVSDQPFQGYFQQKHYVTKEKGGSGRPITGMLVNSKFLRPSPDEEIREKIYRAEGLAWAGEASILKVELRWGPAETWQSATLDTNPAPYTWTRWSYDWQVPMPGKYTLEVRATDSNGNMQPSARDSAREDAYELNSSQHINVIVGR